jgi:hypothetical protein
VIVIVCSAAASGAAFPSNLIFGAASEDKADNDSVNPRMAETAVFVFMVPSSI